LQHATHDQNRHRGGKTADDQPAHETDDSDQERPNHPLQIDFRTRDHDPDQIREHERRQDPPVIMETTEIVDCLRQDGDHRQRLERPGNDGKQQTDGQLAETWTPDRIHRVRLGPLFQCLLLALHVASSSVRCTASGADRQSRPFRPRQDTPLPIVREPVMSATAAG